MEDVLVNEPDRNSPIAVLLSGGVDSSVALSLLKAQGFTRLRAFYLKIWLEDELSYLGSCPWEEDLAFARAVCESLEVELEVVPLQSQYWHAVVNSALDDLKLGLTPSPDILCNSRIKFGAFLDYLAERHPEYPYVASGHYAALRRSANGSVELCQAADRFKDQTYFLSALTQQQLARCLFPLGPYQKDEVRKMACEMGLPTSARPDSQGICFLGKIKYDEFVKHYLGERPGSIVEAESGRVLGEHRGYWFHTIGQRKGLGLGGGPWFVVAKDLEANLIKVSRSEPGNDLGRNTFLGKRAHWLQRPLSDRPLTVKLRHGPNELPVSKLELASKLEEGFDSAVDSLRVSLGEKDRGIAAGQTAVFYQDGVCIGSCQIADSPWQPSTGFKESIMKQHIGGEIHVVPVL